MTTKALIVISGGLDSAVCSAWAASKFDELTFVSFDYGQRHFKELDSAFKIACLFEEKSVGHYTYEVPVLMHSPTSPLTNLSKEVREDSGNPRLASTFVPGRNLIFLTQASSIAIARGIFNVVTGVCQTDEAGYPDCRQKTISALNQAIYLGNEELCKDSGFMIHTPLMYLTKAETIELGRSLPMGQEAIDLSWTCYEGGERPCGKCPACIERLKGFHALAIKDPILERIEDD